MSKEEAYRSLVPVLRRGHLWTYVLCFSTIAVALTVLLVKL
jgi:hypothetical protein